MAWASSREERRQQWLARIRALREERQRRRTIRLRCWAERCIQKLQERIDRLRNQLATPRNLTRIERLRARQEAIRQKAGLGPGLPVIRRDAIRNMLLFERFGCDTLRTGPETPDQVTPDREIFTEFFAEDVVAKTAPDGRDVEFWGFRLADNPEPGFPSDTIRVVEGEIVHNTLHSRKGSHTIHHHGIEPTTFNDGVPHTSFEVNPRYTYQFRAAEAGTYFYHCHVNTVLHFEMGMYGFLIVDPPKPQGVPGPEAPYPAGGPGFVRRANDVIPYDVERLWAVDDVNSAWRDFNRREGLKCPFEFDSEPMNVWRPDLFAVTGVFSDGLNSITDPTVAVQAGVGDRILIRLLNAGYTVVESTFEGLDAGVIDVDGRTLGHAPGQVFSSPFVIPAGTPFALTTARRYTMLIEPDTPGTFPVTFKYVDWINGNELHTASTVIEIMA